MTPYRDLLTLIKGKLEEEISGLMIFVGLKQAVPKYPACCVHIGRSAEKAETFAGGRSRVIPFIFTVMVQGLAGREDGYLNLADLTARVEDVIRQSDFLEDYSSSLVATEFVGNPIFSDNNLVMQAQMVLMVEVGV
jgi:hypothetical protein